MKRMIAALAFAGLLSACASLKPAQLAEKADTDASLAYAAVASSVNAYEGVAGADAAKAEALKLKAWEALMIERQAYAAGQAVDLTALTALVAQAQALGK
jgi:hypothetical protein